MARGLQEGIADYQRCMQHSHLPGGYQLAELAVRGAHQNAPGAAACRTVQIDGKGWQDSCTGEAGLGL